MYGGSFLDREHVFKTMMDNCKARSFRNALHSEKLPSSAEKGEVENILHV